jgi:hypothetical protein
MDLYYRGYDPHAPITSGAQHLSAAAARFAVSIVRSIPLLPDAVWAEFQRLLTVDALWSLCVVLAGWLVATVVGGPVGLAVNALLVVYGLVGLWEQLKDTAGALKAWAQRAYEAKDDREMDAAAQHFAQALSTGGLTVLEVVVTHRVFRAVEGKLRERFPTPGWLDAQYREAVKRRGQGRRAEEKTKARELAGRVADVVTSGARYEGAKRAADDVPTAAMVVGGAVLAAGAVLTVAWALSTDGRRVRP